MSSSIPTSSSVTESAVIQAPLSQVWHLIKLQDFHKFWTKLSKSEHVQGASPETDIVQWTFEDGTVLDVKLEEHSVGALFVNTQGAFYDRPLHNLLCEKEGSTFVQWSAHFSSDADAGVIEDARFKRKEALADLAKVVVKQ
ncbi:MAG: hypothetical protein LQ347_004177 [Umbilicaria vellea]|nr:MAG: hypothetical protein LQ347_004177 [Umbilicaria vellea]